MTQAITAMRQNPACETPISDDRLRDAASDDAHSQGSRSRGAHLQEPHSQEPHSQELQPHTAALIETTQLKAARALARAVIAAPHDARAGQIVGGPGTGKTAIGNALTKELHAIRICAWDGIGKRALLIKLAAAYGLRTNQTADMLVAQIVERCAGRLIIIDEANHLRWNAIEMLRIFIDEGHGALLLIGTDLLDHTFRSARTEIYLAQMAQRIGTKRMVMKPLTSEKEIAAYIIAPRFGPVSAKTARAFLSLSKGIWRSAIALADTCERIMRESDLTKLDESLVQTAGSWMARNS